MNRQEATNVFNEGLVKDLNPLATPDNVLTDCLNGTFITYNGNEFVLQNDQGNFRLKNCRLKENFVPVGIKEYAGILYIMSYNPLTSETEIGSYPSPRKIFDTNDRDQQVIFTPIISEGETIIDTYENLSKRAKLQMYAQSKDLQNFKLNPGDEFRLGVDVVKTFPYQDLKFSVLTEDKELFGINIPSDYVVPVDVIDSSDWRKVFWEVPGWLTGKYELANLNQFYLNIKNIELPEFSVSDDFDFTLYLNSQLEISDDLFLKNTSLASDLKVEYTFWVKDSTTDQLSMLNGQPVPGEYIVDGDNVRFVDSNGNLINRASFDGRISEPLTELNYTNLYKLYYNNYMEDGGMEFKNRSKNELVYVSAVPVLIVDNVKVYYEQFRTNLEVNLATISNADEIEAANITFKHTINNDSATVTFNIQGPFANNSNTKLHCDIYKLNAAAADPATTFEVQDVNFFGQNTIDIPFDSEFVKEDIYILTFRFEQNSTTLKHVNKIFIASQTLNKYYNTVSEYNSSIKLSEWLHNFKDFINITASLTQNGDIDYTSEYPSNPTFGMLNEKSGYWPTSWIQNTAWKNTNNPTYDFGLKVTGKYNLTLNAQALTGNLWGNYAKTSTFNYVFNDSEPVNTIVPEGISTFTINTKLYKRHTFLLNSSAVSIYNYTIDYLSNHLGYVDGLQARSGFLDIESDVEVWYGGGKGEGFDWRGGTWYKYSNKDWKNKTAVRQFNSNNWGFGILNDLGLPIFLVKLRRTGSGGATLKSWALPSEQHNYGPGFYFIAIPTATENGTSELMTVRTKNYDKDNASKQESRFPTLTEITNGRDYLVKSVNQFCDRTFFARNVQGPLDMFWVMPRDEYNISVDNSTITSTLLQIHSDFSNFNYRSSIAYSSLLVLVNDTLSRLNINQVNVVNPSLMSVTGNVNSFSFSKNFDFDSISYSNTEALNTEITDLCRLVLDQTKIFIQDSNREYDTRTSLDITKGGIYYDFAADETISSDIKQMYQNFIDCLHDNPYGKPGVDYFYIDWDGPEPNNFGDYGRTREEREKGTMLVGPASSRAYFPGYMNALEDYKSPFK